MQVVVMAAGMGSRFGRLKQMEPMDEYGNFILDYSLYDAKEAGFDEVIFVIKKDFYEAFRDTIGKRVEKIMSVKYAFQELDNLPQGFKPIEGRIKPWGTGQAILAAKKYIKKPFIIINGDDYYGKETYKVAYEFLSNLSRNSKGNYANIAFKVANTMTENGAVKRGVCFTNKDNYLESLIESNVEFKDDKVLASPLDDKHKPFMIEKDMLVSMNLFCFTKDFLDLLEKYFIEFLKENSKDLKSEYLIPDVVSTTINKDHTTVKILQTNAVWYGVTYQEDKEQVYSALKALREKGFYKQKLYED